MLSSPFLPIDHHFVSPTPSTCSSGTSGKSAEKGHFSTPTPSFSMENFVWKTTEKERIKLQDVWAKFFYKNHLADDPFFRSAIGVLRLMDQMGENQFFTENFFLASF